MPLRGHLDEITREQIRGWAWDSDRPDEPVELQVLVDGRRVMPIVANAFRRDLELAGFGNGRHGFSLDMSVMALPITETIVQVQSAAGAVDLIGSPSRLEAPLELNEPARQAMIALLQSPGPDEALRARITMLAEQADRLLQRLADRQSNRLARTAARSRKWRWQPADGPEPPALSPRALVIDHAVPAASRDAGSNAILSHMASLQRLGYEVTFVPIDLCGDAEVGPLVSAGIAVPGQPWIASVEEVLRRHAGEFDLVYLHRVDVAQRYLQLIRAYLPRTRIVFSVADLHHLRLSRQIKVEDRPEAKPYVVQMRAQELLAASASHAVLTHSSVEAALLRQALPRANVVVVPWSIPPRPTPAAFAERSGIGFIGNYRHAPNLHAALWLVDEIMPLVWQQDPSIRCFLAGAAMPDMLSARRDPRIVPFGAIETLDRLFGQVRLTVAPLAFGAGLKGKVADSLAAGVPCICTPVAAEGFALPEPLHALVAEDAAGLARAIVRLHGDEAGFEACRTTGLDYVGRNFSDAVVDAGLRQAAGLPAA